MTHSETNQLKNHDLFVDEKLMNKSGGWALLVILGVSFITATAMTVSYSALQTRKKIEQTSRAQASRNSVVTLLDESLRDPMTLHESLYDPTCVKEEFIEPAHGADTGLMYNPLTGGGCMIGPKNKDFEIPSTDPDFLEDQTYRSFNLMGPTGKKIAGTHSSPVYYTDLGVVCPNPNSPDCQSEAMTMYRYDAATRKYILRYRVRPRQTVNNEKIVSQKDFTGQANIPLETVSRLGDPTQFSECLEGTNGDERSPAWIAYDVKFDSSTSLTKDICISGLGVRPCRADEILIGVRGDGSPICTALAKARCENGKVPVSIDNGAAGGGIRLVCMDTKCRDRHGRLGFVAPREDGKPMTEEINCVVINEDQACQDRPKLTLKDSPGRSESLLGCDPRVFAGGVVTTVTTVPVTVTTLPTTTLPVTVTTLPVTVTTLPLQPQAGSCFDPNETYLCDNGPNMQGDCGCCAPQHEYRETTTQCHSMPGCLGVSIGRSCNPTTVIIGTCGPAHTNSYPNAAAANADGLCNYGTPSPASVSGPGPRWSWSCVGSNGGGTASCQTY